MNITGISGNDGSAGTATPPGQSAAVSGSMAHYHGATRIISVVTVDITDIVKAWLEGSVQNNGL